MCRFPLQRTIRLNLVHNLLPFYNLPEHNMHAIQPVAVPRGDIELGGVSILFSLVCHGYPIRVIMFAFEVFIAKVTSVYGFSADSVSLGYVAALDEDVGEDAMEDGSFIVERVASKTFSLFTCAETSEVLGSSRKFLEVRV